MSSYLKVYHMEEPLICKESYLTLRRRLSEEGSFVEVTVNKRKLTVAKDIVEVLLPEDVEDKEEDEPKGERVRAEWRKKDKKGGDER